MADEITVFWFRRDLRLHDNAGLYHALKENKNVLPVFIFDTEILERLENKYDRRVDFIHQAVEKINSELNCLGSTLHVFHGAPLKAFEELFKKYKIKKVYANHDYEPYALNRDKEVEKFLHSKPAVFFSFKDQCIFEKKEIIKDDGTPYTVFTPYSRKWKNNLSEFYYKPYPNKKYFKNFVKQTGAPLVSLKKLGFEKTDILLENQIVIDKQIIQKYKEQRDFPSADGTTKLSVHLRFGTVSIRGLVGKALTLSETWLNELIWRDFYMMILSNFPYVADKAFKKDYEHIPWKNDEDDFAKWCRGETGFPIVDAGMRELNKTGFMHNRVRMIVSSFLVKDLLIDWRWGEAYFASKLNDFDLSANNGGWQWAAGCGCDAAPYFRVFNPTEQQKKFDPDFIYIKKWIPEYGTAKYPEPMIDHSFARLRALDVYKQALNESRQMKLL